MQASNIRFPYPQLRLWVDSALGKGQDRIFSKEKMDCPVFAYEQADWVNDCLGA
jgi:hypothetical protein